MTKWLLIIYIATDLWLPVLAYDTENACYAALAQWEFQPNVRGACLEATVEEADKKMKRRRR